MTNEQAIALIDLLQQLLAVVQQLQAFTDPVGGIGPALLGLGFLVAFAHGFRAGSRSHRNEV